MFLSLGSIDRVDGFNPDRHGSLRVLRRMSSVGGLGRPNGCERRNRAPQEPSSLVRVGLAWFVQAGAPTASAQQTVVLRSMDLPSTTAWITCQTGQSFWGDREQFRLFRVEFVWGIDPVSINQLIRPSTPRRHPVDSNWAVAGFTRDPSLKL